jgi:hypothetical protein
VAAALLAVGLACAAGNAWVVASRSTIPRALEGRVAELLRLREKHDGLDDVRIVRLDDGLEVETDEEVFRALSKGVRVSKAAWATTLTVDAREVPLSFGRDVPGTLVAMPLALLALGAALLYGARSPIRRP